MTVTSAPSAVAMEAFARAQVRPHFDRAGSTAFPLDLWRQMGAAGLLGIGIAASHGGSGQSYPEIGQIGRTLVSAGGSLGLGMSWMLHNLVAHFLLQGFGSERQKQAYLPAMAVGRLTAAVAISEPGAGAHPKYLKTAAQAVGDRYRIDGEKAYITNGPIADLFIVLAITGREAERNRFSAFLVPKMTPGLATVQTPPYDFLRPSPHCGLKLENCLVPASAMLGEEGAAFAAFAGPFRDVEDAAGTALLAGAAAHLLELLVTLSRHRDATANDEMAERLGTLAALVELLSTIATAALERLEDGGRGSDLAPLLVGFRQLLRHFLTLADDYRSRFAVPADPALATVTRDLAKSMDIAKLPRLMKQRALGMTVWNRS